MNEREGDDVRFAGRFSGSMARSTFTVNVAPIMPTTGTAIVDDDGPHCHRGAPVEIVTDHFRMVGTVTRRRRQPDGTVKLWYDITETFV